MSASILWLLGVLIWIRVYLNVKTAGNRIMWHFLTESKDPSMSSAMVLTSWKITVNLDGAARQMKKQILLDLKQRKGNHAHICSNVRTVRATTKPTQIYVHSGDIDSTGSGNRRSMLRSVKTGSSWFALQGVANLNNDHTKPQNLLTKCLKELTHCQHHSQDSKPIRYHLHPRIFLVWNPQNTQLIKLQRWSSNRNNTSSQLAVVCQNFFR